MFVKIITAEGFAHLINPADVEVVFEQADPYPIAIQMKSGLVLVTQEPVDTLLEKFNDGTVLA